MINKNFARITIISIAVIGVVIIAAVYPSFGFGHLNNILSGTGINANATDFINNNSNNNITNATATANDLDRDQIHYVEAENASDIQAKIDSLPASGGVVFVPAGVYNTTTIGAITITQSNVILLGACDSTIITSSGNNTLIEVANAEGVSIRDMAFKKGYQKQITFYHVNESEITNCKFSDVSPGPFGYPDTYVCVELNASCRNILKNLRIHRGGLLFGNNSDYNIVSECNCPRFDYLYLDQSNSNLIQGSSFKTNARLFFVNSSYNKLVSNDFEMDADAHITDGSCHNLIEGNNIYSNSGFCINLMIGSYGIGDNDYNKIVSNTFRRVRIYFASNEVKGNFNRHNIIVNNDMDGEKGIGCDAGVYIEPSEVVAGFVDDAHNLITGNKIYNYNSRSIYLKESCYNTITENECYNNGYDGILLWMHSDFNTVSNNNCHNNTDCGIMLEDSNRYNLITDNYCNENEKDGIMLFKSDNNIVSDNYLYHNGYCGLWVRDESDGNTILGNIAGNNGWNLGGVGAADAPWSGIRVGANCDNNQINSNRCFDHQGTKTQMWGISIADSASENNMVHDNYVVGNGISGIADSGTGSDIKDNKER